MKYIDPDGQDIVPTDAKSAAQLKADFDKMMTKAEAANVSVQAGQNVAIMNPNAINPATASTAYQSLLKEIAPGKNYYYTSVTTDQTVTLRDGSTENAGDGKTLFDNATLGDSTGRSATVIEVFVPATDGPQVYGQGGNSSPLILCSTRRLQTSSHLTINMGSGQRFLRNRN